MLLVTRALFAMTCQNVCCEKGLLGYPNPVLSQDVIVDLMYLILTCSNTDHRDIASKKTSNQQLAISISPSSVWIHFEFAGEPSKVGKTRGYEFRNVFFDIFASQHQIICNPKSFDPSKRPGSQE